MKKRLGAILSLSALLAACGETPSAQSEPQAPSTLSIPREAATASECALFHQYDMVISRVDFKTDRDFYDIVKTFDIVGGSREARYVLLDLNQQEFEQMRVTAKLRGWTLQIDQSQTQLQTQNLKTAEKGGLSAQAITNYSCYRTVEETYATASNIANTYPNLATWTSFGKSWLKTQGRGGYDLMVLKLTNKNVAGPKPRMVVTAAIHAREYTTAELATRFAEYLVNNYGKDADITYLLDHQEIDLVMQMNPDGRKKAEAGALWRKNVSANACSTSSKYGTDMNRNHSFGWGGPGVSYNPCDETYLGPTAASEPEVKAEEALLRSLFTDKRGSSYSDAAPADTSGIYIDIHSAGGMVLWPWGAQQTMAPNGKALQTLGRKMAYFNNYSPEQAVGLYPAAGGSDDFAYGELGVASFTYELGNEFFESCSSFNSTIVPDNIAALLYAFKTARAPYQLASGPDVLTPSISGTTLTAQADATRLNTQNGSESVSAIASAEYFIDTPPWAGGTAKPMSAADGNFGSTREGLRATLSTAGLSQGRHTVFVRAKNSAGGYGPVSAVFLNVSTTTNPTNPGEPSNPTSPTTNTYTGNFTSGQTDYAPNSNGFAYSGGTIKGVLTGPVGTDFDLYLEKKGSYSWSVVAKSESSTANESISYNATSGTYRWKVVSYSGSGDIKLVETK